MSSYLLLAVFVGFGVVITTQIVVGGALEKRLMEIRDLLEERDRNG